MSCPLAVSRSVQLIALVDGLGLGLMDSSRRLLWLSDTRNLPVYYLLVPSPLVCLPLSFPVARLSPLAHLSPRISSIPTHPSPQIVTTCFQMDIIVDVVLNRA